MTNHAAHDTHHVNYLLVFGVLCVFTALSVVADVLQLENKMLLIVIVLAIASAKALSVMAFFMHLKFETNWKYVLLAPTMILACGLPLALLPDVGVHYYAVAAPQERELRNAMKDVVESEKKAELLTDDEIRTKLRNRYSYEISVATVARYREVLNIPTVEKLQNAMKDVVKREDKAEPLTDEQIRTKLKERYSYEISLATVVWYREALNIPTAKKRKVE